MTTSPWTCMFMVFCKLLAYLKWKFGGGLGHIIIIVILPSSIILSFPVFQAKSILYSWMNFCSTKQDFFWMVKAEWICNLLSFVNQYGNVICRWFLVLKHPSVSLKLERRWTATTVQCHKIDSFHDGVQNTSFSLELGLSEA